uniref:Uncharacterized protein n=1 Tax=Hyaloperonospora arabidopsidis (strain Emoy2) TaxID=559515 RepID=M4BP93_HYAAE
MGKQTYLSQASRVVCMVLALRVTSCRLRSSLDVKRWVSWDSECKVQALPKMGIFSHLINLSVIASSSASEPSFHHLPYYIANLMEKFPMYDATIIR